MTHVGTRLSFMQKEMAVSQGDSHFYDVRTVKGER